jgi:photosystem II stability/assembly factor-like uncharacterized protein
MKPVTPINIDCIPEKEYLSPEFQLIVGSESNGLFIYETSDPSVFTIDQDGVVTITGPGKAYIIIKQLESENFGANQIDRLIIVNKSKPPITFSGPNSLTLDNTPVSARILKIETIPELIQNVFSVDENILKINRILNDEYELVPQAIGATTVIATTRDNYYFNKNSERFAVEVKIKESFQYSPIVLNINTFQSGFKHDALKEIDILTSNSISDPTNNNIEITFQQESKGYQFDVPILNLEAKSFINSINNYNKEILCCTETGFLQFSIQWNFNNNIVYDFFPYEGNINDRPRISIFRSDGKYIDYVSGGFNFLKIPRNSGPENPDAYIYKKWDNRNIGIKQFRVPDIECLVRSGQTFVPFDPSARANFWDFTQDPSNKRLSGFRITYTNGSIIADWGDGAQSGVNSSINYSHTFRTSGLQLPSLYYGVDFFTREDLLPSYLYPPENFWEITNPNPGEKKYRYLFVKQEAPWIPKGFSENWSSITMSDNGRYQTAVAVNDKIYISSDFGDTWSPKESNRDWRSVSMSSDGRRQTAVVFTNGQIYISTDYGNTWVPKGPVGLSYISVAMSRDGQRQTAVVGGGQIYISTDFGDTWSPKESNRGWISVSMSSNGQRQTAVVGGGQIYISTDFGDTWSPKESNRDWRSVAMSINGEYQTAVARNDKIYISSDYGNTWAPKQSVGSWRCVAMTSDGEHQIVTVEAINNVNNVYISSDYGNTWEILNKTTNLTNANSIDISDNTLYITVGGAMGNIHTYNNLGFININNIVIRLPLPSPTELFVTDLTQNSMRVNWNNVIGATGYRIDVSTNSNFSNFVGIYNNLLVNTTNQLLIGLTAGTTYYVRVRAVNDTEVSTNSPTLVQVAGVRTPASLTATNIQTNSFIVNWGPTEDATSYRLDVATDTGFTNFVPGYQNKTVNETTDSVTGLNPGVIYYVRVRAVNSFGESVNSGTLIQITVPLAPNEPVITNVTNTTFTASWSTVTGASEYQIDVATTSDFSSGFVQNYNNRIVNGTSIDIINLASTTIYYVRVRAVNTLTSNSVTSINSPTKTQSTAPNSPNQPIATNITNTSFTANWNTVVGATSYRLDVATDTGFTNFVPGYNNKIVNTTSNIIVGLTAGSINYIRIRSVNSAGISNYSNVFEQLTLAENPLNSEITAYSTSSKSVFASWSPKISATNYVINASTAPPSSNSFQSLPGFINKKIFDTNVLVSGIFGAGYKCSIKIQSENSAGITPGGGFSSVVTTETLTSIEAQTGVNILAFAEKIFDNKSPAAIPELPERLFFRDQIGEALTLDLETNEKFINQYGGEILSKTSVPIDTLVNDGFYEKNIQSINIDENSKTYAILLYGGAIITSIDSGLNWFAINKPSTGMNFYNISITNDGRYIAGVGYSGNFEQRIPQSYFADINTINNSNLNWQIRNTNLNLLKIAISNSGLYQTAIDFPFPNGNIYKSLNSGITWTLINGITGCREISMSSNGKYQSVSNSNGIYVSNNYGQSWTKQFLQPTYSLDVSSNGQYQTCTSNGFIFYSNDYGVNWNSSSPINYNFPPNVSLGSINFDIVRISKKNPKYQIAAMGSGRVYRSKDFGFSWEDFVLGFIISQNLPLDSRVIGNWRALDIA